MSAPLSIETRTEALRRVLTTNAAHGWEFSLWEGAPDEEPRIRDVDAAARLGYERPRKIRELIKRIWPENKAPHCRSTMSRQSTGNGGSREYKVNEFWLTEAQLLKVIARSETAIAEAILDEMIRVYMAVRRHLSQTIPVVGHARALPGRKGLPAPEVTARLSAEETATLRAAAKVAGMPVGEFVDTMVSRWIVDLKEQLVVTALGGRRRERWGHVHSMFVPLTAGLRRAIEMKADEVYGKRSPDNERLAAYLLLEMGAHPQATHEFAALSYKGKRC